MIENDVLIQLKLKSDIRNYMIILTAGRIEIIQPKYNMIMFTVIHKMSSTVYILYKKQAWFAQNIHCT